MEKLKSIFQTNNPKLQIPIGIALGVGISTLSLYYIFKTPDQPEPKPKTKKLEKKISIQLQKSNGQIIESTISVKNSNQLSKELLNIIPDFDFDNISISAQNEDREIINDWTKVNFIQNDAENERDDGHWDVVEVLAVLHGEKFFVSGSRDTTIKLWSLDNGKCIKTMRGHSKWITCLDVFPREKRIVSGSEDKMIKIWNLESGECEITLKGHTQTVANVVVYNNGTKIISSGNDFTIRIWNLSNNTCERVIESAHEGWIKTLSLSNNYLISGANDGVFKIWDINNLDNEIYQVKAHKGSINDIKFIAKSGIIVTAGDDHYIRAWKDKKLIKEIQHADGIVNCLTVDSQANVIYGSEDQSISMAGIYNNEKSKLFVAHKGWVNDLCLLSNGTLLTASSDKTIKLWNVNSKECIIVFGDGE